MNIIRSLGFGISTGCTVFVFVNLIGYWLKGKLFLEAVIFNFPQQVLGSIIVSVVCILSSYIYRVERLTFLQQSACHFFIAISIFLIVASSLEWIPILSIRKTILFLLVNVIIFALFWLLFYFYSQSEVNKINKKINEQTDFENRGTN